MAGIFVSSSFFDQFFQGTDATPTFELLGDTFADLAEVSRLNELEPNFARFLDSKDRLGFLRSEFEVSIQRNKGKILDTESKRRHRVDRILFSEITTYFAGSSLGLLPRSARRRINEELEAWSH